MKKIRLMGILNVTPDSFSDGELYFNNPKKAADRAEEILREGADIIDIGGESTRPDSQGISAEEEIKRVIPVVKLVRKSVSYKLPISVDTNKSIVAEAAVKNGATIINNLGGITFDNKLSSVIKRNRCQFFIYHIKGVPETMRKGTIHYGDVIKEIKSFFKQQINLCIEQGIKKRQGLSEEK